MPRRSRRGAPVQVSKRTFVPKTKGAKTRKPTLPNPALRKPRPIAAARSTASRSPRCGSSSPIPAARKPRRPPRQSQIDPFLTRHPSNVMTRQLAGSAVCPVQKRGWWVDVYYFQRHAIVRCRSSCAQTASISRRSSSPGISRRTAK